MVVKYSLLAVALTAVLLTACEGKKSLDGYPMDKPPPSAFAPRDSEPDFGNAADKKEDANTAGKDADK